MAKFNIYTVGKNNEYTVHMVKNLCEEFETLTYDQAMKLCELLAEIHCDLPDAETEDELRDQIQELEDENEGLKSDLDYYQSKAERLQDELNELKSKMGK